MNHQTVSRCRLPLSKKRIRTKDAGTRGLPKKRRSYVWHYFDQLGNTIKCRVCRHEFTTQPRNGTSALISHLERIHGLEERGIRVNDIGSIPTKSRWPEKMTPHMSSRVFENFEQCSGGSWQCKDCSYVCQIRKLRPMFYHLKTVHWKANGPASADEFVPGNHDGIIGSGLETPKADKRKTKNDVRNRFLHTDSNFVSNKAREDEPRTLANVRNESETSSGNSSIVVDEEPMMNGTGNGHYEIKLNLLDGSEVEGLVVGGESSLKNAESEKRSNNLVRDSVHKESWIVSKKRKFSLNLQRGNDRRENHRFGNDNASDSLMSNSDADDGTTFDHWRSKKLCKKLNKTSSKRSKIEQSCMGMRTKRGTKKHDETIILKEPGPPKLKIQVPLRNLQPLITDIKCGGNKGQISINPYKYVHTEKVGKKQSVAVISLNQSKALNALSKKLVDELNDAVIKFDNDNSIGAMIITGSGTVFAADFAGTDINEMHNHMSVQTIKGNAPDKWNFISNASKPVIAAVNGYALGSGCELAMMCDIIYAGEVARFGQPGIVIGSVPGAGGTQRLTRVVGKSRAMEMVLTGNQISAIEAERSGLVSKIFPPNRLLVEAIKLGERISAHPRVIVAMAKKAVKSAYETTIKEGLPCKKKLFCRAATTKTGVTCTCGIEKRSSGFENDQINRKNGPSTIMEPEC